MSKIDVILDRTARRGGGNPTEGAKPGRRLPSRTLALLIAGLIALIAPIASVAPAEARPCTDCPAPDEPPIGPTQPTSTTVVGATPNYGWSGDTITLSGYHLSGAQVTVSSSSPGVIIIGDPQLVSSSEYFVTFTLPTILSSIAGPAVLQMMVHAPGGDAVTALTVSPSLHTQGSADYAGGLDGHAWASFDVDRAAGAVNSSLTVWNMQTWMPLSVNASVVWLNAQDQVIGYTEPQNLTVAPTITLFGQLGRSDLIETKLFSSVIGPNPGVGSQIHSARVLLVRDHAQEMAGALQEAFAAAQTIASLLMKLAPLLA